MDNSETQSSTANDDIRALVAGIVAAYVTGNTVAIGDLPALIASVHAALTGTVEPPPAPTPEMPKPAVPIRRSVMPDHVVCLECGKPSKILRRHLRNAHGLSPGQYRVRWGLSADYPMVAPDYAAARSEMARRNGFGRRSETKSQRSRKP